VSRPDKRSAVVAHRPARKRAVDVEIACRLASNVRRIRRARGFTQQELAARCQLDPSYINKVEQAAVHVAVANLAALAMGLACSFKELLN